MCDAMSRLSSGDDSLPVNHSAHTSPEPIAVSDLREPRGSTSTDRKRSHLTITVQQHSTTHHNITPAHYTQPSSSSLCPLCVKQSSQVRSSAASTAVNGVERRRRRERVEESRRHRDRQQAHTLTLGRTHVRGAQSQSHAPQTGTSSYAFVDLLSDRICCCVYCYRVVACAAAAVEQPKLIPVVERPLVTELHKIYVCQ